MIRQESKPVLFSSEVANMKLKFDKKTTSQNLVKHSSTFSIPSSLIKISLISLPDFSREPKLAEETNNVHISRGEINILGPRSR